MRLESWPRKAVAMAPNFAFSPSNPLIGAILLKVSARIQRRAASGAGRCANGDQVPTIGAGVEIGILRQRAPVSHHQHDNKDDEDRQQQNASEDEKLNKTDPKHPVSFLRI